MLNLIGQVKPNSPVSQDFIWVGEYLDAQIISEYDFIDQKERSFYSINRDKLINFGLIGKGFRFYFSTLTGIFNLADAEVEIRYETDDDVFHLTGVPNVKYNDIIQYKTAASNFDPITGIQDKGSITSFNIGYKVKINHKDKNGNDVNFHFKPIFRIPYREFIHLYMWLVCDTKLDGRLIVMRNKVKVFEIDAPLEPGLGGETIWVLR